MFKRRKIESEIRGMEVSNCVEVSAIPQVRELLVAQQQLMGKKKAVVMDGEILDRLFFRCRTQTFMTASEIFRKGYHELIAKGVGKY